MLKPKKPWFQKNRHLQFLSCSCLSKNLSQNVKLESVHLEKWISISFYQKKNNILKKKSNHVKSGNLSGPLQKTASDLFCSFYSYTKPTEALPIDLITTAFPSATDETIPPQSSKNCYILILRPMQPFMEKQIQVSVQKKFSYLMN